MSSDLSVNVSSSEAGESDLVARLFQVSWGYKSGAEVGGPDRELPTQWGPGRSD